jgi:hypothetical protein
MSPTRLAQPGPSPSGPPSFAHVILTRFNVRWVEDANAPSIGTDPVWLENRFALFERYCLPSILGQSRQNFTWLIFFDGDMPQPYRDRAAALASLASRIVPIFCGTLPIELVQESVRKALPQAPRWLLTSRLDNDDGLHADFAATVQAAQRFEQAEVLNCPTGVILRDSRAYRRRDPSNAFISLSEPFAGAKTVFSILRHVYASESYPLRQLTDAPMWLQVIHTSNVSNRVRGRRAPLAWAQPGFPPLADAATVRAEAHAAILVENLTLYILRSLRDFATTSVRRTAKLFGVDLRRKAVQPRGKTVSSG